MWWTLAATTVASVTAIFISTVVYPWQKSIDRSADLLKEKRLLVGQLVALLADTEQMFFKDLSGLKELRALAFQGSTILSRELNDAVFSFYTMIDDVHKEIDASSEAGVEFKLRDTWFNEFKQGVEGITDLTRAECFSTNELHPTLFQWTQQMIRGKNK